MPRLTMTSVAHGDLPPVMLKIKETREKSTMSTTDAPKKSRETDDVPVPATLRKSLKNRHIQLIALGGAMRNRPVLWFQRIHRAGRPLDSAGLPDRRPRDLHDRARAERDVRRGSEGGRVQLLCHSLLVQARRLHLRLELLVQLHPRLDGGAVRGGQIRKLLVPGDSDLGVGSRIPSGHLRRQSAGRLQVRRVRVLVRHHQDCGRDCHDRRAAWPSSSSLCPPHPASKRALPTGSPWKGASSRTVSWSRPKTAPGPAC